MSFLDNIFGSKEEGEVDGVKSSGKDLSTGSYKGVRDFYPEDMAIQQYIFDVWSATAESFGFERYDASVLEPSELYKSKGAENEEMVKEQTYTFTDRGGREVTLRPEMTPTVARMIAGRRQELSFPVRWYSIPNLFRYERTQKGRLREHWQLNCDIFGTDDYTADVETITLAYQILLNFGADPEMFEIRLNNRSSLNEHLQKFGITNDDQIRAVTTLLDRRLKMSEDEFNKAIAQVAGAGFELPENEPEAVQRVREGLNSLGITNVKYDSSIVRGFDYYTGTVFEIFDTSGDNKRSMLGGGRYDNLTALFGGDPIPGVGFGMGDVTMRDFLETHNLLTSDITAPRLMVIPTEAEFNLEAQKIAQEFRAAGLSAAVDLSARKLGKKIASAGDRFVEYALVLGENEIKNANYTLKNLATGEETSGTLDQLLNKLS